MFFVESTDDAKIVSYHWEEVDGPVLGEVFPADAPVLRLLNLDPGNYTFRQVGSTCIVFSQDFSFGCFLKLILSIKIKITYHQAEEMKYFSYVHDLKMSQYGIEELFLFTCYFKPFSVFLTWVKVLMGEPPAVCLWSELSWTLVLVCVGFVGQCERNPEDADGL